MIGCRDWEPCRVQSCTTAALVLHAPPTRRTRDEVLQVLETGAEPRLLSRDTALLHALTPRNPAPPAAPRSSPTLSFRSSAPSPPAAAPAGSQSRWPGGWGDRSFARPVTVTEGGLAPDL
uniref:Uncharacterized protein n=1 Tax=Rangifer tarandus platyrhynchus TaxID=3082113 RepID=A0ACB0E611_RANTA|nr:unnamed protein product [Rangifer tarandus platyrhynchus]